LSEGVQWEGLFELSKKHGGTTYLGSYPLSSVSSTTSAWRSRQQVLNDTGYVGSYPFSGTTSDYASGTPSIATEQMHVGVVGKSDYDVLINYLQTLGDVKILSNPKLAVTNNQEARIHVGERQAYITTTTTAGQTTTTVSEEVTFLDVGLQLHITPTINDEGYITLNIKPEISSVIGTLTTAQNNKIPILDTSTAETTVMVKDGTTVAVGGLRREESSHDSSHFPMLHKIPVLGMLFKSETKRTSRSELLIMVTAHVVEGDELTTGESRDLGKKTGKEYKEYDPVTTESDLTAYEKEHSLEQKMYQEYPDYKAVEEYHPTIKPLKDE
jgi:type II secretory pathway component GspD/PulD (secretin)